MCVRPCKGHIAGCPSHACLAIDAGVFGTGQHMAAVAVGVAFDDECSAHWGSFHPGTWAMKGFLPRCLVLMPLLAASGGLTITMPA